MKGAQRRRVWRVGLHHRWHAVFIIGSPEIGGTKKQLVALLLPLQSRGWRIRAHTRIEKGEREMTHAFSM